MYISWHQSVFVPGLPRCTRFCSTVNRHWPSVDTLFCNTNSLKRLLSSWLLFWIQQPICYAIRGTHSPESFYKSKMGFCFFACVLPLLIKLHNWRNSWKSPVLVFTDIPTVHWLIMTKHNITPCFRMLYSTQYLGHVNVQLPEACTLRLRSG